MNKFLLTGCLSVSLTLLTQISAIAQVSGNYYCESAGGATAPNGEGAGAFRSRFNLTVYPNGTAHAVGEFGDPGQPFEDKLQYSLQQVQHHQTGETTTGISFQGTRRMEVVSGYGVQEFPTSLAGYLDRPDGGNINFQFKLDSPEGHVQTGYLQCYLQS